MLTSYQLAHVLQMNILDMVPHMRNAFEGPSPLVVGIPLVPDAQDALGLTKHKGKLVELRGGAERERGVLP